MSDEGDVKPVSYDRAHFGAMVTIKPDCLFCHKPAVVAYSWSREEKCALVRIDCRCCEDHRGQAREMVELTAKCFGT